MTSLTRYETISSMSESAYPPGGGEVAVLVHSESGSEDGLTCVMVDSGMNHDVEGIELTGFVQFNDQSVREVESPVKEPLAIDPCEEKGVHLSIDPLEPDQDPATVTPQNMEEDQTNEYVRNEVLQTCSTLLTKLETVRLSVLHLQYSLHAGSIAAVQRETTDRSSRLWAWDTSSDPSNYFTLDIPTELQLSEKALAELDVFGVPTATETIPPPPETSPPPPEVDNNIVEPEVFDGNTRLDDVAIGSKVFNGTATTGCF